MKVSLGVEKEFIDDYVWISVLLSVLDNKNGSPYLFYQRQFWSCVKVCADGDAALGSDYLPGFDRRPCSRSSDLYFCFQLLGNILLWDGILSISCLKDLALDSTLNRYILSALQTTDTGEENVQKCQKVGNTLADARANMLTVAVSGVGVVLKTSMASRAFSRWWSVCRHCGSPG